MKSKLFHIFILAAVISSCTNQKKMIYLQGSGAPASESKPYDVVFKTNDIVSIIVIGMDESSTKPFNLPYNTLNQNIGGYTQGAPTIPGYLIDNEGFIEFPIVGKIKIGGLKRNEAVDTIKKSLASYLSNPTVIMRIVNYKVTVLGEVRNPGTFTIPNERITLLEALGIAGDLQITGIRKNVLVIRDNNGQKTETIVDLTSKSTLSSPVYYLQQNDVIYVQPNRAKINSSVINPANVSLIISVLSILVTIAVLFTR